MPKPWVDSRLRTLRISISSVPWRRSGFSIGQSHFPSNVDGNVDPFLSNVNGGETQSHRVCSRPVPTGGAWMLVDPGAHALAAHQRVCANASPRERRSPPEVFA